MIIEALLNVVYTIFDVLTSGLDIPSLPEGVAGVISTFLEYLSFGLSLLGNWTHLGYLLILFGLVVAVDAGILLYYAVMWFLRKLPFLNID